MNKNVVFTSHRLAILYFSFLARAGDEGESLALSQEMTKRERVGDWTGGWQVRTCVCFSSLIVFACSLERWHKGIVT